MKRPLVIRQIPVQVVCEPDPKRGLEAWKWLIEQARKAAAKKERKDDEAA